MPYSGNTHAWTDWTAVATGDTALPPDINSPFNDITADLSTVKAEANGALVKTANLSDLASAATARTNLGASTRGVTIFTSATYKTMLFSEFSGASNYDKFVTMQAAIAAGTVREVLWDDLYTFTTAPPSMGSTHSKAIFRALSEGYGMKAGVSMQRLLYINTATDVSLYNMTFEGAGFVTSNIVELANARARMVDCEAYDNTATSTAVSCITVQGSNAANNIIQNTYAHTCGTAIKINNGPAKTQVINCRVGNYEDRGFSVIGGANTINGVLLRDLDCEGGSLDSANPVRVDGASGIINHFQMLGGRIYDTAAAHSSADAISLHAQVYHFLISGTTVERLSDVGIQAGNGVEDGLIIGNKVTGTDTTGINIGAAADTTNNKDVAIVGNAIFKMGQDLEPNHTTTAAIGFRNCERCTATGNHIKHDATNNADYDFYLLDSTDTAIYGNSSDEGYKTARFGLSGTNSFRKIDGEYPGEPPMISGAPGGESWIRDTSAGAFKGWTGSAWAAI